MCVFFVRNELWSWAFALSGIRLLANKYCCCCRSVVIVTLPFSSEWRIVVVRSVYRQSLVAVNDGRITVEQPRNGNEFSAPKPPTPMATLITSDSSHWSCVPLRPIASCAVEAAEAICERFSQRFNEKALPDIARKSGARRHVGLRLAAWLGQRSLASGLFLIYAWSMVDMWPLRGYSVRYGWANQANSALHPSGVPSGSLNE